MTAVEEMRAKFDRCMLCGVKAINTWPPSLQVHEIARGPHRAKAREERCDLLITCPTCHEKRLDAMPIVQQLAIKLRSDPEGYDRVRVNLLRGRQENAITEGEVLTEKYEMDEWAEETGFPYPRWRS